MGAQRADRRRQRSHRAAWSGEREGGKRVARSDKRLRAPLSKAPTGPKEAAGAGSARLAAAGQTLPRLLRHPARKGRLAKTFPGIAEDTRVLDETD
uniref:Uncharacterized protein n=1 Tax=Tetraselmis sp. GSL018 TaxID=582737 RepID=A0A061RID2_9CHLO